MADIIQFPIAGDPPLAVWYCDQCGDRIEDPELGYVIWKHVNGKDTGFKIIHQRRCDDKSCTSSVALPDLLGPNGLAKLLSFLSYGPAYPRDDSCGAPDRILDMDEFVDLIRRVQTPHYEAARRRFEEPEIVELLQGSSEVAPYLQDSLIGIIRNR